MCLIIPLNFLLSVLCVAALLTGSFGTLRSDTLLLQNMNRTLILKTMFLSESKF